MYFSRDGCRPFIELFSKSGTKLYSTCTDYDRLVQYNKGVSNVNWSNINVTSDLSSDFTLVINHARASIGSKMLSQSKITPIRIASVQFNLFFESDHQLGKRKLVFVLSQLDDIEEMERYSSDFRIEIQFDIIESDSSSFSKVSSELNENEILLLSNPECVFPSSSEYEEFVELYSGSTQSKSMKPNRPPPPPPPHSNKSKPLYVFC